jgi:hypothetical protein
MLFWLPLVAAIAWTGTAMLTDFVLVRQPSLSSSRASHGLLVISTFTPLLLLWRQWTYTYDQFPVPRPSTYYEYSILPASLVALAIGIRFAIGRFESQKHQLLHPHAEVGMRASMIVALVTISIVLGLEASSAVVFEELLARGSLAFNPFKEMTSFDHQIMQVGERWELLAFVHSIVAVIVLAVLHARRRLIISRGASWCLAATWLPWLAYAEAMGRNNQGILVPSLAVAVLMTVATVSVLRHRIHHSGERTA